MKSKRILAFTLSVAMILSLMPIFTLTASADETQTTTTEKNIMPGTSALKGKQQSNVWFGNYQQSSLGNTEPTTGTEGVDWIESTTAVNNGQGKYYSKDPIKWRVLDTDNDYNRDAKDGKTDTTRSLFLLSDQNLDVFQYHLTQTAITWYESTMRSWLNGYDGGENDKHENYSTDNFIDSAFSSGEKNAIVKTKVINSTYDGIQGTNPNPSFAGATKGYDTEDKIFLLSIAEAMNTVYGFNADKNDDEKRVSTNTAYVVGGGKLGSNKMSGSDDVYWWLRSPGGQGGYAVGVRDAGDVFCSGFYMERNNITVRLAFNVDAESVLFTSSKGEKSIDVGNIKTNESYTTSGDEKYEYKLTMLDESRTFEVTEKMARDYKGETITFNYANAESGSNEYISAMIVDNSDEVLYYGQVQKAEVASGTVKVTLPSDIADGKYTLKLFNEQINGDYKTDFSSAFSDIDLTIGLEGSGTETDPYLIHTLSDLEYFRDKVNAQEITSHSVMLTADITIDNSTVWKPIALTDHCKSTFDGKGHTITFANTKEGSAFGLFDSYNYSTIKNLYLAGSITCNSASNVGVLVNRAYSTTIQNVISTCTVNNSGTGPTGGLTGYFGGGSATIKNSAVYADVTGGGYAGGLIGSIWNGNQPCSISNSAYMGSVTGVVAGALVGYNGNQSGNRSSFTDVYYYEKNGLGYLGATNGGTITANRVESKTAEQFRSGEVAYLLNNGVTDKTQVWYQTCKTDSYPKFKGDTVYRGYVCGSGSSNPIYANSMDGLIIKASPEHIYDETGFCENCKTAKPADLDTTENIYKIYSLGELKWFADKVNGGETAVNGKLMNDIDATSLGYIGIGKDASHTFAGTFDGNNKTLKIALVSTEQYVAPFPHIGGATIKNLTVTGTVKTTHKFAAGIVGRVESGNAKIENCLSLVEINSTNYSGDGTHGGLLAVTGEGSATAVNNCGFAGAIIGKTTTSCGGIVGWAGAAVKISNSFVAAKFELQSNSGDTFARNQKYVTVANCYYLNALSDAMYSGATQATADRFASGEVAYHLQGVQETQIWGQKIGTDTLPTFSTAKVYEDTYNGEKIYRNEIDGNKIFSLGADKKSATVLLDKAGTYTIVFADYEANRLANIKTFEVTVDKAQAVRIISDENFTLGTGDKIMLWDNFVKLTPMCEAYEVK